MPGTRAQRRRDDRDRGAQRGAEQQTARAREHRTGHHRAGQQRIGGDHRQWPMPRDRRDDCAAHAPSQARRGGRRRMRARLGGPKRPTAPAATGEARTRCGGWQLGTKNASIARAVLPSRTYSVSVRASRPPEPGGRPTPEWAIESFDGAPRSNDSGSTDVRPTTQVRPVLSATCSARIGDDMSITSKLRQRVGAHGETGSAQAIWNIAVVGRERPDREGRGQPLGVHHVRTRRRRT